MTSPKQFAGFLKGLVKMMPFSLKGDKGEEMVLNALLVQALKGGQDRKKVKDALYYLQRQDDDETVAEFRFINDVLDKAVKNDIIQEFKRKACHTFLSDHASVLINAIELNDSIEVYYRKEAEDRAWEKTEAALSKEERKAALKRARIPSRSPSPSVLAASTPNKKARRDDGDKEADLQVNSQVMESDDEDEVIPAGKRRKVTGNRSKIMDSEDEGESGPTAAGGLAVAGGEAEVEAGVGGGPVVGGGRKRNRAGQKMATNVTGKSFIM
jgi:hypothetical protein